MRLAEADEDGLITVVSVAEQLARWATAAQLAATAELASRREDLRFVEDDIAAELRLSRAAAAARLALALALQRLPAVAAALAAGQLDLAKATAIAEAVRVLDPGTADDVTAEAVQRAGQQTAGQLRAWLRRKVLDADPDAAEKRHAEARDERRVVVTPVGDGMAELWALLPADEAARVYAVLQAYARAAGTCTNKPPTPAEPATPEDHTRPDSTSASAGPPRTANPAAPQTGNTPTSPHSMATSYTTADPHAATADPRTTGGGQPTTSGPHAADDPQAAAAGPRIADGGQDAAVGCRSTGADPAMSTSRPSTGTGAAAAGRRVPAGEPGAAHNRPTTGDQHTANLIPEDVADHLVPDEPADHLIPEDLVAKDPGAEDLDAEDLGAAGDGEDRHTSTSRSRRRGEEPGTSSCTSPTGRCPAERCTADQRRADALVDLLTGHAVAPAAKVHVIVPLSTLTGVADHPGEIAGLGPIPAGMARQLAADGVWRWLAHTDEGTTAAAGQRSYRPSPALAELIRGRDVTCRFPGCRQPAHRCDLDHTTPYPEGPTTAGNLAALCRHHHQAKHQGGWSVRQHPNADLTWTSPTGRTYSTSPPHRTPARGDAARTKPSHAA